MQDRAADLARRLAEQAGAVCRHYLSSGRREGRYWLVGDADNTPGRSLYVRLKPGDAGKPAGKWTDAATGEHGDLLDIIARRERLTTLRDTLDEARRFLALPRAEHVDCTVVNGGKSRGSCAHWHPVAARYWIAFQRSRARCRRGRPTFVVGASSGAMIAHSRSVQSLAYRNPLLSCLRRAISVQLM